MMPNPTKGRPEASATASSWRLPGMLSPDMENLDSTRWYSRALAIWALLVGRCVSGRCREVRFEDHDRVCAHWDPFHPFKACDS